MEFSLPPFFYEIFHPSLPRLGPGSPEATQMALGIAEPHLAKINTGNLKILDVGCGNGSQTLQLSTRLTGSILAVDNHQPFLDELLRRAKAQKVDQCIDIHLGDMNKLKLEPESFDLIWSEGAFFVMGIFEALSSLQSGLKKGGILVFSDLLWLKENVPAECKEFLNQQCPIIYSIPQVLEYASSQRYQVVDHFTLQSSAWSENFNAPLEARLQLLRSQHSFDSEKCSLMDSIQTEIDMYRKYSDYYGYEFFILKR